MSSTIVPNVLISYACKCGACRRTCCRDDWDVAVTLVERDRAHKTMRIHPELAGRDVCITENPHARGSIDACRIEFDTHGLCPLMTVGGICEWHAATGAPVSRTCAEFPRVAIDVAGVRYAAATIACEAVVEVALRSPDPIQLMTLSNPTRFDDLVSLASVDRADDTSVSWCIPLDNMLAQGMALLQSSDQPLSCRAAALVRALWDERIGESGLVGKAASAKSTALSIPAETAVLGLIAKSYVDAVSLVRAHGDHAAHVLRDIGFACDVTERGLENVRLLQPGRIVELATHANGGLDALDDVLARLAALEFERIVLVCVERGPYDAAILFAVWLATMRASLLVEMAAGAAPDSPAFVDAIVRTQRALAHTRNVEGLKRWLRTCGLYSVDALAMFAAGV